MTPDDFRTKWHAEAEAMRRRRALAEGAVLCDELLSDFDAVTAAETVTVLNLQEAEVESGYPADYLGRLVRAPICGPAPSSAASGTRTPGVSGKDGSADFARLLWVLARGEPR